MISFPKELTATIYPGYFWDVKNKKLYSIKVGGVLKKLPKRRRNYFTKNLCLRYTYSISVNGRPKLFSDTYLEKLALVDSEIPKNKA